MERKRKRNEEEKQKMDEELRKNGIEMNNDEVEERKKLFFKTIKTKNWGKIFGSIIVGIIFIAYFVQIYVYHNVFEE